MPEFRYGPVELYLVGFEGERPDAGTMAALSDLLENGLMRLLDLVLISKSGDGDITVAEIEADEFALELHEVGIAGEEDIAELAELVPPGGSAMLVALELSYARELAQRVSASGAVVLSAERIPAPIVNAVMDLADEAGE
ncbi:DUF6325 family protein [Microbacterium sp. SSW1-59]|uniref:DUF6325 family protein n=1 Tax=Microbacterium xanthum TaxID=3079794 RepID=UPI002AD267DF|nr:DUF6325 family protein [Microbacterium sp. SSW1-59]MDZ8200856.1 DUF6325 family protein [Microbacterium sp. SSW1-59]